MSLKSGQFADHFRDPLFGRSGARQVHRTGMQSAPVSKAGAARAAQRIDESQGNGIGAARANRARDIGFDEQRERGAPHGFTPAQNSCHGVFETAALGQTRRPYRRKSYKAQVRRWIRRYSIGT
jgi:hypothetical protein